MNTTGVIAVFDPATEPQLKYIRLLVRKGYLSRADFTDNREYRRKRTMNRQRASALIQLGRKCMKRVRDERTVERLDDAMRRG